MAGFEREAEPAIVQHHARCRRQDGAAEGLEERVDEGAGIAVPVHDREIDRVLVPGPAGRRQRGQGPVFADRAAERGGIVLREQHIQRHIGVGRVGDEGVAVAVGEPGRLDEPVHAVC